MGGGDLNLKKSWHPSTLRNIERVWKAEKKNEVEKQKIEQLQKELAEEKAREEIQAFAEDKGVVKKRDERLDWMYQGPSAMVNREEYLLGRKIDKTLETMKQVEKGGEPPKEEGDIGATMFSSQNLSGTATVDLANKIREDPLFNIMKQEKEERRNLLTNPVKMKQLQQLLKASLSKPKSKKSKKNKKKKHHDVDGSDGEKLLKRKKKHHKSESSESEEEQASSKYQHKVHGSKHKRSYKDDTSPDRKSSKYNTAQMSDRRQKKAPSQLPSDDKEFGRHSSHHKSKYSMSESKDSNYGSSRDSNHQQYRESARASNRESSYQSSHYKDLDSHRSSSHKSYDSKSYNEREGRSFKPEKKKLDSSERERLLKEMQENAKWRDDQRKRNTQRYKEEEEKEDNYERIDTSDFLKPMLAKAAGKGSLEKRVKQKIFSIQRSSSDMDKNFARRD